MEAAEEEFASAEADPSEANPSTWKLCRMSFVASFNNALDPLIGLVELALLANARFISSDRRSHQTNVIAAYSFTLSVVTFLANTLNFFVIIMMSSIAKAVGSNSWKIAEIRIRFAIIGAFSIGLISFLLLVAIREPLMRDLFKISDDVKDHAGTYYVVRCACLPFILVQKSCMGILGGYQKLKSVSIWKVFNFIMMTLSNYITLIVIDAGSLTLTYNSIGVFSMSLISCVTGLLLVEFLSPDSLENRIRPLSSIFNLGFCCYNSRNGEDSHSQHLLGAANEADESMQAIDVREIRTEFCKGASNMFIRSFLLSGSIWVMSIYASRLGSSQLAAHQIVLTLWSLTSYLSDGFADVGTMLGAKYISTNDFLIVRSIFRRLLGMGLLCGCLFAVFFLSTRNMIENFFTRDADTKKALRSIWPLLSGMQVVNSLVFVYDGLIYATASWSTVRNIMILGCVFWFLPGLIIANKIFHSLLSIWFVKAGLNLFRCCSAIYVIEVRFWRQFYQ